MGHTAQTVERWDVSLKGLPGKCEFRWRLDERGRVCLEAVFTDERAAEAFRKAAEDGKLVVVYPPVEGGDQDELGDPRHRDGGRA